MDQGFFLMLSLKLEVGKILDAMALLQGILSDIINLCNSYKLFITVLIMAKQ